MTEAPRPVGFPTPAEPVHRSNKALVILLSVILTLIAVIVMIGLVALNVEPSATPSDVRDIVRRNNESLSELLVANQSLLDTVLECTTPTPPGDDDPHECYEEGQRRTQEAIDQIIEALRSQTPAASGPENA